jgi:sugar lactone lactonase YvrE
MKKRLCDPHPTKYRQQPNHAAALFRGRAVSWALCVLGIIAGQAAWGQSYYESSYFSTLAGLADRGFGSADGIGTAARFHTPSGVAVDSAGNVFVADTDNHTIRKISSEGVVTTVAGLPGFTASADGSGSEARFNRPGGVAVDTAGNLYVADTYNQTIRKITNAGLVTTIAGQPYLIGATDGVGSEARFNYPTGVAVDSAGNVYVADWQNSRIRKISSGGVVTTVAGPGPQAGQLGIFQPVGVAVDSTGNIYVGQRDQTIRKIRSSDGFITTVAGLSGSSGSADGTGSAARFYQPDSTAVDGAGNVYVTDTLNDTVRKISSNGVVTTVAGEAGSIGSTDGSGNAARFNTPGSVAVDEAGNLYVADTRNNTIRKITSGGAVTTLAGTTGYPGLGSTDGTGSEARFFSPSGLTLDSAANVFVADTYNSTIRKISSEGVVTTVAGLPGFHGSADGSGSEARFNRPLGLAVDTAGNLYVADTVNHTIRKITSGGTVTTVAGLALSQGSADGTGSEARFRSPAGVAVDSFGNVYVADGGNRTIRKVDSNGMVTTVAGLAGGAAGRVDGTGSEARFSGPNALALDAAGNLYVVDNGSPAVGTILRKVSPGGVVTTLPGSAFGRGFGTGIAVDSAGSVYVAYGGRYDSHETVVQTIRKITAGGTATTVAGLEFSAGSADGTGSAVRFDGPHGIAVDNAGTLYVADRENNTIRVGSIVPRAQTQNISTRLNSLRGDNVLIGGFIITGETPKKVMLRAIGPSLPVAGGMVDPVLQLHKPDGSVFSNDNWKFDDATGQSQDATIRATTIPPFNDLESAMVVTLPPGNYTSVVSGKAGGQGIALVEVYDLDESSPSKLANISTRGFVDRGDNVMIGGFIIGPATRGSNRVVVRGLGPSLPFSTALQDPVLQLRDSNGANIINNDNWADDANAADIRAVGLDPKDPRESALLRSLPPGTYTAILSGKAATTGIGLIEVYNLQ